ncbi:MAG: UDP-N-acetylmuramoyl-tripeptide--D-alanyl-D-alanine ligase [Bacteroidales bacterium]|nr:UDP-N-acetylmuramoyl-tripeptide--D-alanyl-D-alanine ligase [Bacteroidales bacterium]
MCNEINRLYDAYLLSRAVTTDSRNITQGCIFFAFKGSTFDGNAFVPSALAQGAALCVTSDTQYSDNPQCIVADDVLAVLQALASRHRANLSIPVIGITGTNGKTTTKELLAAVLRRRYRVHATAGNFNNHLGVPLTLLSIPADCEVAVVEMGANHPGEIDALCRIAQPDFGLITSVGKAHLEGFGSFDGVVRTKTELYRCLDARKGVIFVNADNEILRTEAGRCSNASVVTYGTANADIIGTYLGSDPYLSFYTEYGDQVYNISTRLFGGYNFANAMAALAVGRFFKVDLFDIKQALEQYVPSNNRSQLKTTAHNQLLLDCYNANPTSMEAAVRSFAGMRADRKVVMLGGMRELGSESESEHRRLFQLVKSLSFTLVVLVGDEFSFASSVPDVLWFPDSQSAHDYFAANPLSGASVLLKGSNSNRMWLLEEVL